MEAIQENARRLGIPTPTRLNRQGQPDRRTREGRNYYLALANERTERERQQARLRRQERARARRPNEVFRTPINDYNAFLQDALPHREETLQVFVLQRGRQVGQITITPRRTNQDWKLQWFQGNSSEELFTPLMMGGDELVAYRGEELQGRRINQWFRDSETNTCVFDAARKVVLEKMENAQTKKTRQNYQSKLNQLNELSLQYPDGVSLEDLETIAAQLKWHIEVEDILHQSIQKFGKAQHGIKLTLTNTRMNHLDLFTNHSPIYVSQEELNKVVQENKEKHYIIRNNPDNPTNIETLDGFYMIEDPDKELIDSVNAQVRHCRYDALKYPELNDFLLAGRIVNSETLMLSPFTSETKLIDMKHAYTNHSKCPFYEGFLSQVHQFRPINRIVNVGFYEVQVQKTIPFAEKLGLIQDLQLVLFSPEIKFFQEQGVSFTITAGAWGSVQDISYPDEFVNKKLYQKWTGRLSMSDNYRSTTYTLPATREFAELLKSQYDRTKYWSHSNTATIDIPKERVMVAHHIFGAITSYTRINMMVEMLNHEHIQAVQLDGIFLGEPDHQDTYYPIVYGDLFREKEIKELPKVSGLNNWWYNHHPSFNPPEPIGYSIFENSFLYGAGGTGKTHSILKDKGYINPLYVVPTRELGLNSGHSNWITLHKLLGINTTAYYLDHKPSVLLLDELTMIQKNLVELVFVYYPDTLILLAGDIDRKQHYQCRGGSVVKPDEIFKIPDTMPVFEYTTDYRSKDETLKQWKLDMREEMRRIYTDGGVKDTNKMRDYIRKTFPNRILTLPQALEDCYDNDIFLWSTHNVEKRLTEQQERNIQTKGVHALQGQTIEGTNLYICLDFFEYAMPYTAMSRARTSDQIVWVETK